VTRNPALARAAEVLLRAESVWIGTHVDPDGDAIGSALGLALLLEGLGRRVTVHCQDAVPDEAAFLPGVDRLGHRPPTDGETAVALDVAEPARLGRLYLADSWSRLVTVVIDHHASNPGFGTVNVIDPSRSSTAEMVTDIALVMGASIEADAATCLLTGIVTDTLGFRTSNTTADTLQTAHELVLRGARLTEVTHHVFHRRPLANLRLTALALQRLTRAGPFAMTMLHQRDLDACGANAEAARGITSLLATADEPAAVALLRERPDGDIDVSLRSKPGVDLLPAARALGGGGHSQAAGARLPGPMEAAGAAVFRALEEGVRLPRGWDMPRDGIGPA